MSEKENIESEARTSDYVVDEILGESDSACVYTTKDNQLRWKYKLNDGIPLERHGAIILYFDVLMHQITSLDLDKKKKKQLFVLLGKTLYSGLNDHSKSVPSILFSNIECEITKHQDSDVPHIEKFDLAIICALADIELMSVLNLGEWKRMPPTKDDPQTYYRSVMLTSNENLVSVIAAAPNHMGLTCAGILATKLICKFKPRMVAMTGIAAGSKSEKQGYGDILVPDHTYDYGSSKVVEKDGNSKILPSYNPLPINSRALGIFNEWKRERTSLDLTKKNWPAQSPSTELNIHIGPMFSSPLVLDSKDSVESIISNSRKLVGIEMESHAVHRACNDTLEPQPMFICLKSICDFAQNKEDDWQHYAAYTSAKLLFDFVVSEWESLHVNA